MAELKPMEVIMKIDFAATKGPEVVVHAEKIAELVRCMDCRFFHNGYGGKCCTNHKGVVVTDENGFCHHAERRADNG